MNIIVDFVLLGLGVGIVVGGCWLARWQWRKRVFLNALDDMKKQYREFREKNAVR
jgi:hypothetical protein